MNIQAQFNNEAINSLPCVSSAIKECTDSFSKNQMRHHALRRISNTSIPLDEMTEKQKLSFAQSLIEEFKNNQWI